MIKIHAVPKSVKRRRQWCGPTALAALTGLTYDAALDMIKRVTGQKVVKRVHRDTLKEALRRLGYRTRLIHDTMNNESVTLARFLRKRPPEHRIATILVRVTNHYVVVRGRKIVDNFTKEPVFLRAYPKRRKRVKDAWIVEAA